MNIHKILFILLMGFGLSFISNHSFATADGPDHFNVTGVESWDVLNIRIKPHYKSRKVGSVPYNGKCLINLDCVGGAVFDENEFLSGASKYERKTKSRWCRIRYRGIEGWVNARYLMEGSCQ